MIMPYVQQTQQCSSGEGTKVSEVWIAMLCHDCHRHDYCHAVYQISHVGQHRILTATCRYYLLR